MHVQQDWKAAEKYYARSSYRDMDWGLVLLKVGKRDSGMSVLRRVAAIRERQGDWWNAARVYAALGDKAKCMDLLRAYQTVHVADLPSDPFYDEIRQDPEFRAFLQENQKRKAEEMERIKGDERGKFNLDEFRER